MSFTLEKIFPPLPRTERGKSLVLDAHPNGEKLIYTSGNSVIIRDLQDPTKNDMYTQHSVSVSVAKYSPSGFYIASAGICLKNYIISAIDNNGKVRIWDTVNLEHVLKYEYHPFMGKINDIAWTSDNARMLVGGNGSSVFGAVFIVDSGSSVGTINGMSRSVNSVDFRPARPYRAVTGNDEGLVTFFEGPPFVFKHSHHFHKGFVNVVRYCPDGSFFVTGGADGKIFLHNGENGENIAEVGSPAHDGGVYGLSFSRDSTLCVSASADKSIKLWKVGEKSLSFIAKYALPNILTNMLLGCTWVGKKLVTVSLGGSLYVFDIPSDSSSLNPPELSIHGHKLHITCSHYSPIYERLITASSDGSMASWDIVSGLPEMFSGPEAHKSQVQSMTLVGEYVVTVGIDDRCVASSIQERTHLYSFKLPSQPHSVVHVPQTMCVVVACLDHVLLLEIKNNSFECLNQQEVSLGRCTMSISSESSLVVIGGQNKGSVVLTHCNGKLKQLNLGNAPDQTPEVVSFSPDGKIVAVAGPDRSIQLFTLKHDDSQGPILESSLSEWWLKQSARITCLGWSPNGRRVASGSIDSSIVVWSLDDPKKPIHIVGAHPMSNSTAICWINDHKLLSTANDGSIRVWNID